MSKGSLFRLIEDRKKAEPHWGRQPNQQKEQPSFHAVNGKDHTAAQSLPIKSGFYDHGLPISLSLPMGNMDLLAQEVKRREDYDVFAASHSFHSSRSFYVEPFEDDDHATLERTPTQEAATSDARQERTEQKPGQEADREAQRSSPEAPPTHISNDQFESDLRDILAGKKRYDATKGQTVATDEDVPTTSRNADQPATSGNGKTTENEHEIFERIAQSMKLANAYDLGSVALSQRFDSFDKEMEHSKKKVR